MSWLRYFYYKPRGLDKPCLAQSAQGPILIHRFQSASRELDGDKFLQLRNPDPFGLEIWMKVTVHFFRNVHPDTAFFLGETATMNSGTRTGFRPSNAANFGHKIKKS